MRYSLPLRRCTYSSPFRQTKSRAHRSQCSPHQAAPFSQFYHDGSFNKTGEAHHRTRADRDQGHKLSAIRNLVLFPYREVLSRRGPHLRYTFVNSHQWHELVTIWIDLSNSPNQFVVSMTKVDAEGQGLIAGCPQDEHDWSWLFLSQAGGSSKTENSRCDLLSKYQRWLNQSENQVEVKLTGIRSCVDI